MAKRAPFRVVKGDGAASGPAKAALSVVPKTKRQSKPAATGKTERCPSRIGKRIVGVYVDPAAWRQLRDLSLDEGQSVQLLMVEALNELFKSRRLSRIA